MTPVCFPSLMLGTIWKIDSQVQNGKLPEFGVIAIYLGTYVPASQDGQPIGDRADGYWWAHRQAAAC